MISQKFVFLKNKKLLLFYAGAASALAQPPLYLLPLLLVGLSYLFIRIYQAQNKRGAFFTGWWFGFGYFVVSIYWFAMALLVEAEKFAWLIPFAVFGIAAILAIYIGLVGLLLYIIPLKSNVSKIIMFAISWLLLELLRGVLFTGFPWNLIGYVWTFSDSIIQIASITGVWGLSFLTVFTFTVPALLILNKSKSAYILMLISLFIWVGIFTYGYIRLAAAPTDYNENIKLRIVQGNIDQNHRWETSQRLAILRKHIDMTMRSPGFADITHVIWPESALPFFVVDGKLGLLEIIKAAVPKNGAIITGSLSTDIRGFDIYNSLTVIDDKAKVVASYNKHHLVPFGEYVPFRNILPVEKITYGMQDFSQGEGIKTITAPNFVNFSPLICYEAIFSGEVIASNKEKRPDLLINVTNDAWFGTSTGPYQHLNMAKMRAVEEGIPMIRASNTGVSAIFDAYGRTIKTAGLNKTAIIDSFLPEPLASATIFSNYTRAISLLIVCFFAFFVLLWEKKTQNSNF